MPSGPAHLHERWGDDEAAWGYLRARGYTQRAGNISPPPGRGVCMDEEASALDYLHLEWDYTFEGFRDALH